MAGSFFINRKRTICVVTFQGTFAAADVDLLERCRKEVLSELPQYVILNMAGISVVEADLLRPLTILQQNLRSGARLLLCDLRPDVAKVLKGGGVVRDSELADDLVSALQMVIQMEKG